MFAHWLSLNKSWFLIFQPIIMKNIIGCAAKKKLRKACCQWRSQNFWRGMEKNFYMKKFWGEWIWDFFLKYPSKLKKFSIEGVGLPPNHPPLLVANQIFLIDNALQGCIRKIFQIRIFKFFIWMENFCVSFIIVFLKTLENFLSRWRFQSPKHPI